MINRLMRVVVALFQKLQVRLPVVSFSSFAIHLSITNDILIKLKVDVFLSVTQSYSD